MSPTSCHCSTPRHAPRLLTPTRPHYSPITPDPDDERARTGRGDARGGLASQAVAHPVLSGAALGHDRVRDGTGWIQRALDHEHPPASSPRGDSGGGHSDLTCDGGEGPDAPGDRAAMMRGKGERSSVIRTVRLRSVTRRPPTAYPPGRLPGTLPGSPCGECVLGGDSRLDAFSGSPARTWLPSDARCPTTGPPAVRPTRSSRTRVSSPHTPSARSG